VKNSALDIAAALSRAFPDLDHVEIERELGTGFNSMAVKTTNGLVFRVAKASHVSQGYLLEERVLPAVKDWLPVAVPEPRWVIERSPDFPYGVGGYRMLPGPVLTEAIFSDANAATLASDIAALLLAMHSIPRDALAPLGLPGPDSRVEHYHTLRRETSPVLQERLSSEEYTRVDAWWDSFLSDPRTHDFEPVLSHGDLWYENMLVDNDARRLTGVVDWEHVSLMDPALDFSTQLHLGERFLSLVIDAYRAGGGTFDQQSDYRLRRLWELREFYGVLYCVRFPEDDEAEMADSIRKLRAGPVLNETPTQAVDL
jgi:aminoglycoside phosphotransferase (APT) family kinase protein